MKEIILVKGLVAYVDDEDYDNLIKYKWYAQKEKNKDKYYAVARLTGRKFTRMHRFIMKEDNPHILIDHIDNNSLNNVKTNLRKATASENSANRNKKIGKANSKYLGVDSYIVNKKYLYWRAHLVKNGVIYKKTFKTEIEAAKHYNELAKQHHGKFAKLNKII